MLLREPADECVGRRERDGAALGFVDAGEQAKEGRFSGAVCADDADDVTRGDGQIERVEEGAVAVAAGDAIGALKT